MTGPKDLATAVLRGGEAIFENFRAAGFDLAAESGPPRAEGNKTAADFKLGGSRARTPFRLFFFFRRCSGAIFRNLAKKSGVRLAPLDKFQGALKLLSEVVGNRINLQIKFKIDLGLSNCPIRTIVGSLARF